MRCLMKIKLDIQEKYEELQVRVCNSQVDEGTRELYEQLKELFESEVVAYDNEQQVMLVLSDIVRIYSANKQVFASTESGDYRIRERLYEMEEKLPEKQFVRISNSELVNVKKIKRLDTSITGTIRMYLKGDIETFVSRRNVAKIKKALGI